MNRCDVQHSALVGGCEEMRSRPVVVTLSDGKGPVLCPKPRRVGFASSNLTMTLRWQRSQPAEICDSITGTELLDIILTKTGYGEDESPREIISSNPYFCGSPPSRVSNPLVTIPNLGMKTYPLCGHCYFHPHLGHHHPLLP